MAAKDILLSSKTIIFYSEPILKNGAVIDLKEALDILVKNNMLDKVILYAENSAYNRILEKLIQDMAPSLKIESITREKLDIGGKVSELEEIEALLKEKKNILCIVKGTVKDEERGAVKELSVQEGVPPIIIFKKPYKGKLFSLFEGVQYVIDGLNKDLPPAKVSQDIQGKLKEYQQALRDLSGA